MDSWERLRILPKFAATKEKNSKSSKTYSKESIGINKATRVRVITVNQSQKNPMLLYRGRRWNFTTGYALFLYKAEGIFSIFSCAVVLWSETVKPYVVRTRNWSTYQTFKMKRE